MKNAHVCWRYWQGLAFDQLTTAKGHNGGGRFDCDQCLAEQKIPVKRIRQGQRAIKDWILEVNAKGWHRQDSGGTCAQQPDVRRSASAKHRR